MERHGLANSVTLQGIIAFSIISASCVLFAITRHIAFDETPSFIWSSPLISFTN